MSVRMGTTSICSTFKVLTVYIKETNPHGMHFNKFCVTIGTVNTLKYIAAAILFAFL